MSINARTLKKTAHLDPGSEQAVLQESARKDVISNAKIALSATSQALGLLPTPIPKGISESLHLLVTKIEQTIDNAANEKDLAQSLAKECGELRLVLSNNASPELRIQVDLLVDTLMEISDYQKTSKRSGLRRFFSSADDAARLIETKRKQRDALRSFNILVNVRTEQKVDEIATRTTLQRLPYSEGSSWKPESVCAPNTRIGFLVNVQKWFHQPASTGTPRIFLLTNVAGSGKSAVANSVAQMCVGDPDPHLGSSFFFAREVAGRNTPERMLSNLAVDLASYDPECGTYMSQLLRNDPSLASNSIKRLFYELIVPSVNASDRYRSGNPVVIIIDALDEGGCDVASLQIIHDGALQLPGSFRFFLTSRPHPVIDRIFQSPTDVRRYSLDLASNTNTSDIREYVKQQCPLVAVELGLEPTWPGLVRQNQLVEKSEGLFVWIAVVFDYIRDPEKTCDPEDRLTSLLEDGESIGFEPGEKMDLLYTQILGSCPWSDRQFPPAFSLVVGTLVALETPLSPVAFASYLGDGSDANIKRVRALSPLIAGLYGDGDTVRFIHLSVREFLTSSANARFFVEKYRANQRLALTCLEILNHDLPLQRVGVGYSAEATEQEGVPYIPATLVSEQVRYACNFWKTHISHLQDPIPSDVYSAVKKLSNIHLTAWIELSACLGLLQTLVNAPVWVRVGEILFQAKFCKPESVVQKALLSRSDTEDDRISEGYSTVLGDIYYCLSYDSRLDEALEAIKETVVIRRELASASPNKLRLELADALHNLSVCSGTLGQREEALGAIQDAVKIRRELAEEQPAKFNSEFANSLNSIAVHLSNLGRNEEALSSIKESVAVYRELVKDGGTKFNNALARSLNNLSNFLSDLGQKEESLSAIQEAVTIRRELATEQPTLYKPKLALSLKNLSGRLSDIGRHEEALSIVEEALAMRRELAKEQPAKFNPYLARNLVAVSDCLDHVGRPAEALSTIEEAVTMLRELAKKRPAAFNEDLAISLNNLSSCLSTFGRHGEALEVATEDLAITRQLARERPAVFNARLIRSLKKLSQCLSKLGREEEAKSALEEAESLTP